MKVTTEEIAPCEILMTIEIEPDKEQDLLKKAAKRISRETNIPGFRRGKAPLNTVVRRFGWEVVQQEALEKSSEKFVTDALEETGIEPYARMQLDEITWNPLVLKVKVPTEPKAEIGNYRDIRLDYEPVEITDEDIETALKDIQEENAIWTPVERASQIGDLISMAVTEKDGDEVLAENEAVEVELTDPEEREEEDNNHPDLTTPLLGLSAGESKTFTLTYPEDFETERYAGKEITFEVEVSGVKAKELDPLDDNFAQVVSDFETLAELKDNIRKSLTEQRGRQRDFELGSKVLEQIINETAVVEWPKALEEENIDEEIERYKRQLKQSGITLSSYLQMQKQTEEELREELREGVVERLKRGIILSEIAGLEKLDVSESEILEQARAIADMTGYSQLWSTIMASSAQQGMIATDLISNKAIHRLAAIAKGEEPEIEENGTEVVFEEANEAEEAGPAAAADETAGAEPQPAEADVETDSDVTHDSVDDESVDDESNESTEEAITTKA